MPAKLSFLHLDTYFLKELTYSLKDALDSIPKDLKEVKPVQLEITDLTTPLEEDNKKWRCELTIKSTGEDNEENPYYDFKIVMVGFFKVNQDLSPEIEKTLADSNCPAVLYSTAREIVATITRRSPFPAVLLPLVTFVKNAEETKGKNKPSQKKTKKS